jgi:hypothetical protein
MLGIGVWESTICRLRECNLLFGLNIGSVVGKYHNKTPDPTALYPIEVITIYRIKVLFAKPISLGFQFHGHTAKP